MEANRSPLANGIRQHLEGEVFFAGFVPKNPVAPPSDQPSMAENTAPAVNGENLVDLVTTITACRKCQLSETRKNAVPGEGNHSADLMFVGEAPGGDEDRLGRPFVGRAGQLLDKIIVACGLSRDEVFIANTLKCRPPGNRDPRPEEIDSCLPYLCQQIELIAPKVIVALGAHAARTLTDSTLGIGKLRGHFHPCALIPDNEQVAVMPTYHPAYLLRNYSTENRRVVWEDMKKVMQRLGLPQE